jgi:hypothetical protein
MNETGIGWASGAAIAFISIGIEEALIKPIAKRFVKKKIIKYAPVAMQFLDEQMPRMIVQNTGDGIGASLRKRLESITGESWEDKEIDEMFKIYDPRITADKHPS